MDLEKILKVVSEKGGGHVGQSFQVLLGTTSGVPETSEPKKVIRTKKTKMVTSKVAVVGDEEVPTYGTVGGTQEIGENEVEEDEETQSDKAVEGKTQTVETDVPVMGEEKQTRKRRSLMKAASTQLAEAGESEDTQSDEDVPGLVADSGEIDKGQEGQRDGKEVLEVGEEERDEEKGKGDVGPSTSERRYRR
ncbi:hypothetical protein Dimus_016439, partial [Dionaea muscipula]